MGCLPISKRIKKWKDYGIVITPEIIMWFFLLFKGFYRELSLTYDDALIRNIELIMNLSS